MHPVTRLSRVIQQLRSFGDLHAAEFEALALELEGRGAPEAAARVRVHRHVQRDEGQLVVDELIDIQQALAAAAQPPEPALDAPVAAAPEDQWKTSAKRAQWLEEQAEARQPRTRRDLFRPARNAP